MGKWLIRLLALSAVIVLTVLEWGGACILPAIEMLCKLISGTILILTTIACLSGLASGNQAANAFVAGFAFYLIPRIGGIIVRNATFANVAIINWMKG